MCEWIEPSQQATGAFCLQLFPAPLRCAQLFQRVQRRLRGAACCAAGQRHPRDCVTRLRAHVTAPRGLHHAWLPQGSTPRGGFTGSEAWPACWAAGGQSRCVCACGGGPPGLLLARLSEASNGKQVRELLERTHPRQLCELARS